MEWSTEKLWGIWAVLFWLGFFLYIGRAETSVRDLAERENPLRRALGIGCGTAALSGLVLQLLGLHPPWLFVLATVSGLWWTLVAWLLLRISAAIGDAIGWVLFLPFRFVWWLLFGRRQRRATPHPPGRPPVR